MTTKRSATTRRPTAPTPPADRLRILVADPLSEAGLKVLQEHQRLEVTVATGLSPKDLAATIRDFDAVIVRSSSRITREVLEQANRLKVIGRAGIGVDNVDVEAATKRGIIVMNVPSGNTISTAEHAFSLLLAVARSIPQAHASLKAGRWARSEFIGSELFGKVLGVVGLGRIGAEVARRAQAFGMRVLAYDPYLSTERARQFDVVLSTLPEILRQADYLTIHTPLTPETRHLFGPKEFAQMKRGVRLVNCARGGIVDEAALHDAIVSGRVAGAALDVFEQEPPQGNRLLELAQVIGTPHLGAATDEAQTKVALEIAAQVRDALLGGGIRNAVNVAAVDPQTYEQIRPYLELAETLGRLVGQLAASHLDRVTVTYIGEVTHHDCSPMTVAVLKGLLRPILGESVNDVNASVIASERGIKVVEAKASATERFANLIAVELAGDGQVLSAEGTLFNRNEPRIVKLNGYFVDVVPVGHLLLIENLDRPGAVGRIGTVLGEARVNIAGMTVGRTRPGATALTVLSVDEPVPQPVLEQLRRLDQVRDVRLIQL